MSKASPAAALDIEGLRISLPSGEVLMSDVALKLFPGEIAVLLGGSGSGKSTFSRVLFEPEALAAAGFQVEAQRIDFQREELGLVPQHGALFDHLSVGGNIELAQRYAQSSDSPALEIAESLKRVSLPASLRDAKTSSLSGGQAQRVAVARSLASRRPLLLLDEPSVGLDPHRVRSLARLLREQAESAGVAMIVVTHDPALAAGVADKLLFLDPTTKKLKHLFAKDWNGPVEGPEIGEEERGRWILKLEKTVVDAIASQSNDATSRRRYRRSALVAVWALFAGFLSPFAAAGTSIIAIPSQIGTRPRDFLSIAIRVLRQALFRPAAFYLVVSTLIGFTLLFVISKVGGAGVKTEVILEQIGGSYAVALAPPLAAILFVAASGSATNAWLGSIELTRQGAALKALGIAKEKYLLAPTWVALGLSFLLAATIVLSGMLFGGWLLYSQLGVPNAWSLLTADIVDPRPERSASLARALFLFWVYAWGLSSNVVAKGSSKKESADMVTQAMTQSVVSSTLWVVFLELATVLWIFS